MAVNLHPPRDCRATATGPCSPNLGRRRPSRLERLSESGFFTWREWGDELGATLREAGEPSEDGSHCYDHWLLALERLCVAKGLTTAPALQERESAWAEAYRRTPHGKPIELPRS
jgi:nitrile hydratase accessory protein